MYSGDSSAQPVIGRDGLVAFVVDCFQLFSQGTISEARPHVSCQGIVLYGSNPAPRIGELLTLLAIGIGALDRELHLFLAIRGKAVLGPHSLTVLRRYYFAMPFNTGILSEFLYL